MKYRILLVGSLMTYATILGGCATAEYVASKGCDTAQVTYNAAVGIANAFIDDMSDKTLASVNNNLSRAEGIVETLCSTSDAINAQSNLALLIELARIAKSIKKVISYEKP